MFSVTLNYSDCTFSNLNDSCLCLNYIELKLFIGYYSNFYDLMNLFYLTWFKYFAPFQTIPRLHPLTKDQMVMIPLFHPSNFLCKALYLSQTTHTRYIISFHLQNYLYFDKAGFVLSSVLFCVPNHYSRRFQFDQLMNPFC